MRILMTTSSASLMDGINRHILAMASALAGQPGVEVGVSILHQRGDFNEALDAAGVKNWSLDARNGHDFKGALKFYKVLQEFKPDVIHIHVLGFLEICILKLFGNGLKYVLTVHGISQRITKPTVRDRIIGLLTRPWHLHQSGTIFISRGVHDYFAANESKDRVLASIYNPMAFAEVKDDGADELHKLIGVERDVPIIGTACRIAEVKNPRAFIEVMIRVLELNKRAHAVILGNGDEDLVNGLKAKVDTSEVKDRIHFIGYRADAPKLVRELACFVMTSHCEGMPTSLLECMSQKVPFAFMTGNGGLMDIEQLNAALGLFAICVPKGETDKMAQEIVALIEDQARAREYVERAYAVGRETFDVKKIAQQTVDFYKQVLAK